MFAVASTVKKKVKVKKSGKYSHIRLRFSYEYCATEPAVPALIILH